MNLTRLVLDFESAHSPDYTLKKLSYAEYIRDPRFKAFGASMIFGNNPVEWVPSDKIQQAINDFAATSPIRLVAHNMNFDGLICYEKYKFTPAEYTDTMGLARALLPPMDDYDLDSLGKLLNLGGKVPDVIQNLSGKWELSEEESQILAEYGINDARICAGIDDLLYPHLPENERRTMHLTCRIGCVPRAELDLPLIEEALREEKQAATDIVTASTLSAAVLRSTPKFVAYLESLGIVVPLKANPKGNMIPALAKNDFEFHKLRADYPQYAHLWDARTIAMSNNNITKCERLLRTAQLAPGTMPMPQKYYGAHTGRNSGDGKVNVQNFKRKSKTRRAILAPKGYVIVVADSSQIELRGNADFCGQHDTLELLRHGGDVYSHTATQHFGYTVTKKDNPDERQFGKVLELALGYGMGHVKLRVNAAVGFMGAPPIYLTEEDAYIAVQNYRNNKHAISGMWKILSNTIIPMMAHKNVQTTFKCLEIQHESILLPNGMALQYPGLYSTEDGWVWGNNQRLYGGILLENIIQALARIVVFDQVLAIDEHPDIEVISTTHDEVIALAPEPRAEECLQYMLQCMSVTPTWAPNLPVAAEGGYDYCYSK